MRGDDDDLGDLQEDAGEDSDLDDAELQEYVCRCLAGCVHFLSLVQRSISIPVLSPQRTTSGSFW